MSTPTSSEETTPCCCNRNCGMMIKLLIILCVIVPLILSVLQVHFLISSLILLVGIILSIFAIVNGSKAFGITMLIVTVLLGGPGSCTLGLLFNEDARSVLGQGVEQIQLATKLEEAKAAGNKEEAAKIQAEIDAATKKLEEKLNEIDQKN